MIVIVITKYIDRSLIISFFLRPLYLDKLYPDNKTVREPNKILDLMRLKY